MARRCSYCSSFAFCPIPVKLSSTGADSGRGASAARPGGWVPESVSVASNASYIFGFKGWKVQVQRSGLRFLLRSRIKFPNLSPYICFCSPVFLFTSSFRSNNEASYRSRKTKCVSAGFTILLRWRKIFNLDSVLPFVIRNRTFFISTNADRFIPILLS